MFYPDTLSPERGNRRGFNLIESAIVLGVIGLVVAGIWVAAAGLARNREITELSRKIVFIKNAYLTFTANSRATLDEDSLKNAGIIPADVPMKNVSGIKSFELSPNFVMMISGTGAYPITLKIFVQKAGSCLTLNQALTRAGLRGDVTSDWPDSYLIGGAIIGYGSSPDNASSTCDSVDQELLVSGGYGYDYVPVYITLNGP